MAETTAYLNGVGAFLPNNPIDNDQIEGVLGPLGRVSTRVKRRVLMNNGIHSRHYAIDPATGLPTHTNVQLTSEAIRRVCSERGMPVDRIQCLACGTSSADQLIPSHASMVQSELGCGPCDIVATSGVCCSGMTAFKYGYLHVLSGLGQHAVATGSELASVSLRASHFGPKMEMERQRLAESDLVREPILAFRHDFLRWMLSDGAGAAIIESQPRDDGISLKIDWMDVISFAHESDVCMYAGMVKEPDGSVRGMHTVYDPQEFFDLGMLSLAQDVDILQERLPVLMRSAARHIRDKRALRGEQIDWLLPHYSSNWFRQPLHDGLVELGMPVPFEKWFTNLPTKGNTGAASIFIMLEELLASGNVQPGQRLLCIVPESARMTFCFLHLTAQ